MMRDSFNSPRKSYTKDTSLRRLMAGPIEPMQYDDGPRFAPKVAAGLVGVALIAWVLL
jgi:hypothetical protein